MALRRLIPVAVGVCTTVLLYSLRPLVVSGDGVGYIKRLISPERDVVPGHLLYIPFLEQLNLIIFPNGGHLDATIVATLVSAIGGGLACGFLYAITSRFTDRRWPGLVAVSGLCVSYGFYRASGDVEAYSSAVAIIVAIAWCLLPGKQPIGWGKTIAAGVLLGIATLLHTSLVLITPFVLLAGWHSSNSWLKPAVSLCVGGSLSLGSFLIVSMGFLGMDLSSSVAWIMTADNGYAQPPTISLSFFFRNLGRLFYGICRTFVHSPAPDRLGVQASVQSSAVGMVYLIIVLGLTVWGLKSMSKEIRRRLRSLWAWLVPLVFFGFLFFPAATERWVFILPCLWLVFSLALLSHRKAWIAPVATAVMIALPLVANIITVSQERQLDRRTLERSRAVSELLRQGDLLLYPGHTWDEYIGFYEDAPVERFILASFAGEEQGDREAFLARLRRSLDDTFSQGGRVIAVRVFDAPETHHGWSLLRALGVPRDDVLALLAEYEAQPLTCSTVCVWEILPAPDPSDQSDHQPGIVNRRSRHQHLSSAR